MEITFPVRGKLVKVDTGSNRYDSEVLTFGFGYVVRVEDEVFLAMVVENEGTTTIMAMPKAIFDWFTLGETVTVPELAAKTESDASRGPRPKTPDEAVAYLKNWKAKGWAKPGGDIYRMARKATNNGTANRVVAALDRVQSGS